MKTAAQRSLVGSGARRWLLGAIVSLLCSAGIALGEEAMELTVYNTDLALVKETRSIELAKGVQEYSFTGVPERLLPATVHFRSLTDPAGTQVLEQNYRYDLLDRASLLERYRGKEVRALIDGEWKTVRLLAHGTPASEGEALGRILDVNGEIYIEGFILPALPEGLLLEPTLVWLLDAGKAGKHQAELSYLTEGVSWRCDYVAVVDQSNRLDLTGWVTLTNNSGMDYKDARLKLVAGDVHRVQPPMVAMAKGRMEMDTFAQGAAPGFAEEEFFEYHLYTLGRPTSVLDKEQKQVELLREAGIKATRRYVFESQIYQEDRQARAVAVAMEFMNKKGEGPGIPLPKGTVRVYQADQGGQLQFAGEDELPHTPEGEQVRLRLGDTFDLRGERAQLRIDQDRTSKIVERDFQITLRNHKDEAVEVDVIEHPPAYQEWSVRQASHDYERVTSSLLRFRVKVPADGETVITYTLRTK
jgi:hypothetical protein